jgi:hypothetical protein
VKEKKVENFENSAVFWQPAGTYYRLNMAISKTNPLNFGASSHLQNWLDFSLCYFRSLPHLNLTGNF